MSKKPPCGGCPPCCTSCVFTPEQQGSVKSDAVVVVSAKDYGCVRPDAGDLVVQDGALCQTRGGNVHPVSKFGMGFLRDSGNPLAAHL